MELETPSMVTRLVDAVLNGKESVRLREVRTTPIPSFVKTWFQLGAEGWYVPEYARRLAQSRFDYHDLAVHTLAQQFDQAVQETALFARTDCMSLIEGAVRHEVAYLRQPLAALSALLFRQSAVVDGRHVVDLLTRFQRESYYTEALAGYVAQTSDARLDQDLLEQLLSNVEREAYQQSPMESLASAMAAVDEILRLLGGDMETDQVRIETWASFFETRNLREYLQEAYAVIEAERTAGHQTLSRQELWTAIQDRGSLSSSAPSVLDQDIVPLTPSTADPEPVPESSSFSVQEEEVWSTASPVTPPESVEEETPLPQPTDSQDRAPEPAPTVVQDDSPPSEPLQADPVRELPQRTVLPPPEINEKLERVFIRKLFNKDSQLYYEVLARLEKAASWDEAFSIIEEVWEERGLSLFSKESQEFTRVFYERYNPDYSNQ